MAAVRHGARSQRSLHDGGYRAPTATSVPDAHGRFAMEVSDLTPGAVCDLRVEFCHVNGSVSERGLALAVTPEGRVDLSTWEMRRALEPVAAAVNAEQLEAARAALRQLEVGGAPELAVRIGRKLVGTLETKAKPSPADAPVRLDRLPLGEAQAETAEVGWLQPAANRIPRNDEIISPLLDADALYATGLYAHSPSRYVFNLAGKWQRLRGEAGLHVAHQPHGSVIFVTKTDGKEAFRSWTIRGSTKAGYEVDVGGVKTLELIVQKGSPSDGGNWGLWLEPTLVREPAPK